MRKRPSTPPPLQVKDLVPDPQNRRKHNARNLGMVVDALQSVGAARSIVIDEDNVILAGNGVTEAAAEAGITRLQIVDVDGDTLVAVRRRGLTDEQKRALAMYDNRAGELAEWNPEQLTADQAAGLDLQPWFSDRELVALIGTPAAAGLTDPDDVPPPRSSTIQRGDVFALGPHRLICGDATVDADVARLMGADRIDLVVTSPPYNVNIKYRSHKDRADRESYLAFIGATAAAFMPRLDDGRFVAWNIGVSPQTFPARQVVALEDQGLTFSRQIVWRKSGVAYPIFHSSVRANRIRHYKPNYTHETIQLLLKGVDEALGAEAAPDARYQNDVWEIHQSQATVDLQTVGAKSGTLKHGGASSHRLKEHPAAFPVEVPRALMGFLAGVGERVYDPFGGSGSTLIACQQLDRAARLIELDPVYCQVILDRWEAFTGLTAVQVPDA